MSSVNTFVGESFKNFNKVGSVWPSSSRLAKRIAKEAKGSVIVELGSGTGALTGEILKRLPSDGKLIAVEANEIFARHLKEKIKDSRLKIYVGDALLLNEYLKAEGVRKVSCVISGLPLGIFDKKTKRGLLKEIFAGLSADGLFIQFEYLLAGYLAVKEFFPVISLSYEFFNFPPAFVMKCRKK